MAFSSQDQRRELELVLGWDCFLKNNLEAKAILRVLGEAAAENTHNPDLARMDGKELEKRLRENAKAAHPAGERHLKTGLTRQQIGMYASRARELLNREYSKQLKAAGEICLWFPKEGKQAKPYHLLFERWPSHYSETHADGIRSDHHLSQFWHQIAYGFGVMRPRRQPQRHIWAVFSNESLPDKNDNPRGFSAGSGEVIAAWEISRTLCRLGIDAEIVRSSNAARLLTHTNTVFVFLGSSLIWNLSDCSWQMTS